MSIPHLADDEAVVTSGLCFVDELADDITRQQIAIVLFAVGVLSVPGRLENVLIDLHRVHDAEVASGRVAEGCDVSTT